MLGRETLRRDLGMERMTSEQRQAVLSLKRPILLSASAGSGKTFVLSTRVVYGLADPERGLEPGRLLVVTFTRMAAAEMRSRIAASLHKLVGKHPSDRRLLRQQSLLPQANITTIDSFCSGLLREQFERAGLSPSFRVGNDTEIQQMKADALDELFEEEYQADSAAFQEFCDLFSLRGDEGLREVLLGLYDHARTRPFPEEYLSRLADDYRNPPPVEQSRWAKRILEQVRDELSRVRLLLSAALQACKQEDALRRSWEPVLTALAEQAEELQGRVAGADFLRAPALLSHFQVPPMPRYSAKKNPFDRDLADRIKADYLKPAQKKLTELPALFCTQEEYAEDMAAQLPVMQKLVALTGRMMEKIDAQKQQRSLLDFPDLLLITLSLLVRPDGDGFVRTPFGEEMAERFDEILVDEFQDINEAQDMLFRALSKDERTLFMVGDVKQSIYGFREASPEVFLRRRRQYLDNPDSGTLIRLTSNFRSRPEVTGCVNYLFGQTMTEAFGGVDYCNGEQLVSAGNFPENSSCAAELHTLAAEGNAEEQLQTEAEHLARTVRRMLDEEFQVSQGETSRACNPGDFAVLCRTGKQSELFAQKLRELDVSARTGSTSGYFEAREVSLMLSLLQVVDNPLRDVPMLAVLLSPVFGFTPDEVAALRLADRGCSLYVCLSQSGDPRAAEFLQLLSELRHAAAVLPLPQLIQKIYDETLLITLFGASESGQQKLANLRLLLNYAEQYEGGGGRGLSGFLRLLDRARESGKGYDAANVVSENQPAVHILTIHKSKGLEFPIVLVARCGSSFNEQDFNKPALFSTEFGFAMKRAKPEQLCRYPTLPYLASVCAQKAALRAEELRVLYVAMTRAKEKLILVSTQDAQKWAEANCLPQNRLLPAGFCRSARGFSDWLFAALLRHPDLALLPPPAPFPEPEFSCPLVWVKEKADPIQLPPPQREMLDPDALAQLRRQLAFVYPYRALSKVPAKLSVTQMTHTAHPAAPALRTPRFTDAMTAAERGTATHAFLQFSDFSAAQADLQAEIDRLRRKQLLTARQAEALDKRALAAFFCSDLYRRICNADAVEREKSFFYELPAEKVAPEAAGETILVQGIADCVLTERGRLTIIDYKTDRATAEQLREQYAPQLALYKRALEVLTGLPVQECLLYSLRLRQTVPCPGAAE